MATLIRVGEGRWAVQFRTAAGKRPTIRLGKLSEKKAQFARERIEDLIQSRDNQQSIEAETKAWLAGLDSVIADRLVVAGLVRKRQDDAATLGKFIDDFLALRSDMKPNTRSNFDQARTWLLKYFAEDLPLYDLTPGDADEWFLWMQTEGLGRNSARRHAGRAKQVFRLALRKKLVEENPFADLKCSVGADPDRFYFVTVEEAQKALAACPDGQWRLLFALARYGGLRVPSEALALRWDDVDWAQSRMTVTVPKLEHVEGKETRLVPLFPELLPYLTAEFEAADEGSQFVIT